MNDGRKEYTFMWLIENYSYYWHKNKEALNSPLFVSLDLQGTTWYLNLYPRGYRKADKGYISLFLRRSSADDGPVDILLSYELSIIVENESASNEVYAFRFPRDVGYGPAKLVNLQELLLSRKDDFLPHDTLRVLCKILIAEGNIQQAKQIVARTCIGIERISFLHVIEKFSSLELNQDNTKLVISTSKDGLTLSTSLYYSKDSLGEENIMVKITPSKIGHFLSRCKISLIEKSGKEVKCVDVDYRFDTTRDGLPIENMPFSLSRQNILERKSLYLPDDKLSLQYECTFSTGIESEKIVSSIHGLPKLSFNQITDKDFNNVLYDDIGRLSECPSVVDDFKSFYNNQLLTDIEIKTKTKSFPAHKFVISARSSVFQAMLTNDMKEKNSGCIQIDDLEDDTVQQLMLFLYSDEVENLQWESAIKLYYAADKYAIGKLKAICSSFLMKNITTSSAIELLNLADIHNDSDFKKAIEDFIFKHDEEVFGSEEWRNLIETNCLLVSKTMCLKYMRK